MSITAINEQLLRAIGVGVALVRQADLQFVFFNQSFAEWFGTPDADARLDQVLEGIDVESMKPEAESFAFFL